MKRGFSKGSKHTDETKNKMKKAWERRGLTFIPPFKGKKMSEESRRKMSVSAKKRTPNRIGKKHTPETRAKISAITRERTPKGENHYAWKNGASQRLLNDRRRPEYFEWRIAVFLRDKFTCQKCGDNHGGNLRAHHILGFANHPDLRYDVDNGVTLCHICHERVHFKPDSIRNIRKLKRGERLWH